MPISKVKRPRRGLIRAGLAAATIWLVLASRAATSNAQTPAASAHVASAYSDFFDLAQPGQLSITGFGGGFRSDKYATTEEGFQLEQSVTNYVGVAARVTGYQLYVGQGFNDPLSPSSGASSARLNFVRLLGGIDISPYPLTKIYLYGGRDFGDSTASVVEGDISSWFFSYSRHPLNAFVSSSYDTQNKVDDNEIDLRLVALTGEQYMAFVGGGGALYTGGFIHGLQGQGGPDLGVYLQRWQAGIDLQGGYGSAGWYGEVNVYKTFVTED
jgi:hypothetical protein